MLTVGENFSHYSIISVIGEGGMGEVYLARDLQLERKVAIKLLRKKFSGNDQGLRRFIQEAKAASALNHPNIITIYEIGRLDDSHYIAAEYVRGHTLHELLATNKLSLEEILNISIQVAEALAAAHKAGIVHRDIKPENIMVRDDGYVKVLDFGLAKLLDRDDIPPDVNAETQKMFETSPGVIMGTVSYMSPEQARGTAVDTRTDIWSLGVVLFQMLTGRLPFTGDTTSDVIAALLRSTAPKLSDFAPDSPKELEHIVDKTLRRDREERYQHIKDFLLDLKDVRQELNLHNGNGDQRNRLTLTLERSATTGDQNLIQSTVEPVPKRTHSLSDIFFTQIKLHPFVIILTLAVLIPLMITSAIFGVRKLSGVPQGQETFERMRLTKITNTANAERGLVAVSPDGKWVAYVVQNDDQRALWVRQAAVSGGVQIVPPAKADFQGLTFSRDGNYIYYSVSGRSGLTEINMISVLGGETRRIIEDGGGPVSFSPDGKRFAFIRGEKTLFIADADGSNMRTVTEVQGGMGWWLPTWSPNGTSIICAVFSPRDTYVHLVDVSVDDGTQKELSQTRWLRINGIAWLPDGRGFLFIGRDLETKLSQIWKMTYPDGQLSRVTNDLSSYQGLSLTADASAAVSVQENRIANIWTAPEKNPEVLQKITSEVSRDEGLSGIGWSPDGRIVYTTRITGSQDIWIVDRDGGNNRQLTFNSGANFWPVVSPDGKYIVFVSDRSGVYDLWRMSIDGSGAVRLTEGPPMEGLPDITGDGKSIIYQLTDSNNKTTIWKIGINGGNPVQLTTIESSRPTISPDNKYIACQYGESDDPSAVNAAIIPIAGGEPIKKLNIPSTMFRWAPDGRSLIYTFSDAKGFHLRKQPLDGSIFKNLADFQQDRIFRFDISRFGGGIVFARGSEPSDVVMIKDFK